MQIAIPLDIKYEMREILNEKEKEDPMQTMTLANRDLYLTQIEAQINAKRKLLLDKQKILKKASQENRFLEGVRNDYNRYYSHIVSQKEEQIRSIGLLKQYIDDMIVSGKLTDKDIKDAKQDQRNMLKEINEIKSNLDNLIAETGDNTA